MSRNKQVNSGCINSLDDGNLQIAHEARDCHPEIIADKNQALNSDAVTLPQGANKLRDLVGLPRMQTLFKLVQYNQQFFVGGQCSTPTNIHDRFNEPS